MTSILVTGSAGFIGSHLVEALRRRPGVLVVEYDLGNAPEDLDRGLASADFIFHLAGINRPKNVEEYQTGNVGLTAGICESLAKLEREPVVVLSSSVQAGLDNPYGVSKRQAEEILQSFSRSRRCPVVIFRLQNAFGKWCRPNYNSVTATFCHNIAHDLPLSISDPNRELELVYIDDIIAMFLAVLDTPPEPGQCEFRQVKRSFKVTLGGLAARIRSFRESRRSVVVPSFEDEFTKFLYATYLSYLDGPQFVYELEQKTDQRGSLAEFMKAASFGQVFVSRTKPGVTRGNHFHHTKAEKFLVVEGEAVIRFRHVLNGPVIEHRVSGKDFRVLDIPPGYTHSIENVGTGEMVVLFWASEAFDPQRPDTYALPVQ